MSRKSGNQPRDAWLFLIVILFVILFSYLSMNLKNVDYGYKLQELLERETTLKEEINKLEAEKAALLNLERVEQVVTRELDYRPPRNDQIIKVFVDSQ